MSQNQIQCNMYSKETYENVVNYHNNNSLRFIERKIHNNSHMICNEQGELFRKMKTGFWKKIENKENHKKGYNVILIDKKQYMRAKLIMYFMDKVDLCEKHVNIIHINHNKLDCSFNNLSIKGNNHSILKSQKA